jgi:hypothetical protein
MGLSWNVITDRALAEALSLARDLLLALLAAVWAEDAKRWLAARKSGTTGNGGHAATNAHRQRVQSFTRLASDPPKLMPEQEGDLIDRGLPERLVRAGSLDYASLTSGCMADRIRNGYA